MLEQNINAKNHPDWLDKGDENPRQTWIDARADALMGDPDIIRDAIACLCDEDLIFIGNRTIDTFMFHSCHSQEACEKVGIKVAAAIKAHAQDIAEKQWEHQS